jgi:hypothetical protein
MTLDETKFRCFSCKKTVEAKKGSICKIEYENKHGTKIPAAKGICSECGCKLSKILKKKKTENFNEKYSECSRKTLSSKGCSKSTDTDTDTMDTPSVAEVGGIFALLALLAGGIAVTVKSLKQC